MTDEKINSCHPFEGGADMYRLAVELKMQERKIINFSASVNPLGVSKKVKADLRKHLKYLHNYPDPEAERLRKRLAQYFAIDPETILCGNGSTELLYLIPRVLNPAHVLIPAPTCPEYERACRMRSETRISYFELKEGDGFHLDALRHVHHDAGLCHHDLAGIEGDLDELHIVAKDLVIDFLTLHGASTLLAVSRSVRSGG